MQKEKSPNSTDLSHNESFGLWGAVWQSWKVREGWAADIDGKSRVRHSPAHREKTAMNGAQRLMAHVILWA
jgi:hypothetical protein